MWPLITLIQWTRAPGATAMTYSELGPSKEMLSALLVLCVGNLPVTTGFLHRGPVMWNFDGSFVLNLNKMMTWWHKGTSASAAMILTYLAWNIQAQQMHHQVMNSMLQMLYIDGLMQERRNSSTLAMELRLSCNNPSISAIGHEQFIFVPIGSRFYQTRSALPMVQVCLGLL